jgi:hypothetical protein
MRLFLRNGCKGLEKVGIGKGDMEENCRGGQGLNWERER